MDASAIFTLPPAQDLARRAQLPFLLGAGLDLVLGLDLALFDDWIAQLLLPGTADILGLTAGTFMRALGVILLLFAAETIVLATTKGGLRRLLPAVPILNWCWVAISLAAIALWHEAFSGTGIGAVLLLAFAVAGLAVKQGRTLRAGAVAT